MLNQKVADLLPKQNIIFDFYSIYAAFEHFMSTVCPFILNNPPTENGKEGGVI